MKKLIPCLLILLISGCGRLPFHMPFTSDDAPSETVKKEEKTTEVSPTYGVSPEAQIYLTEAMEYWTDSGECMNPEAAAALLDKAIDADPLDPMPYLMRSLALSDLGYYNEAFDDATKSIRLSPTAQAYATRGLVCLKQRHLEGARRDFEYAEKINAAEPLIYVYRSAGAFLEGRDDDACDDLKHASELGLRRPWDTAVENGLCR